MEWPFVGRDALVDRFERVLRRGSPRVLVLSGEAGCGKSRLARQFIEVAERFGHPTAWAAGVRSGSDIPFSAFAHLLPNRPDEQMNQTAVLINAVHALRSRSEDRRPLILAVDDVHALDRASVTLLHHYALGGGRLVTTHRSGESMPDPIEELLKDDQSELVEVPLLSREATEELLAHVLDGHVDGATRAEIWRLTGGNPLYLREVITGSLTSGSLRETDGMWSMKGPLTSGRLVDIISSRLETLSAEAQQGLLLIAVAEPVELDLFQHLSDDIILRTLEDEQLIGVNREDRRSQISLAHPVYGEVLRSGSSPTDLRSAASEVGEALRCTPMRRSNDALRAAKLQLEAGEKVDAGIALEAARSAFAAGDVQLTARLARSLPESFDSLFLLGSAFALQGSIEEADKVLAKAVSAATDDHDRAQAAIVRGRTLAITGDQRDLGLQALEEVLAETADPDAADMVTSGIAWIRAWAGELDKAVQAGERVLARDNPSPMALTTTLTISTVAKTMIGDLKGLDEEIEIGLDAAAKVRHSLPVPGYLLQINEGLRLMHTGKLEQALQQAESNYDAAVHDGTVPPRAVLALHVGQVCLLIGLVDRAIHAYRESAEFHRVSDPVGSRWQAPAMLAVAHGFAGHHDEIRHLWEQVDKGVAPTAAPARTWVERARAWVWITRGDFEKGAQLARAAGNWAADRQHYVWACMFLHDAVRIGKPEPVVSDLEDLAEKPDGPLVASIVEHARALAAGNIPGLVDVADRFGAIGARLYSAEATAQAADVAAHTGHGLRARQLATKAALRGKECQGANTPALQAIAVPLTDREIEIARHAAQRYTSKEIANRLNVSVRTIDNHLGSVYRKLGIGGRAELRGVFKV